MEGQPADTPERRAFYERIGAAEPGPALDLDGRADHARAAEPLRAGRVEVRRHPGRHDRGGRADHGQGGRAPGAGAGEPGLRGQSKITTDLYAGVQMVLPGEVAPAHRHSQTALRFVLEGSGAHTVVDGERTAMREGDFIITPAMTWHDHGNEGDAPMFWLDGLDIPVVQFVDASFAEPWPHGGDGAQPITRRQDDSLARFGANLMPVDHTRRRAASPIFNYPYARTREALESMKAQDEWDPCHGLKMRYANPETGGHATTTMGTFMQLLPKGFHTQAYRSTDATIVVPMEGRGRTHVGSGFTVEWGKRDIFVVPSWQSVRHEADEESVLFSFSDRPIQEALGLFREDRGNA